MLGIYLSALVLLPIAALTAKAFTGGPSVLWRGITNPEALAALKLTLVVAVIVVGLATATSVAAAPPIVTLAPATKLAPLIVSGVPPALDPAFGLTPVMRGAVEEGAVSDPPHADASARQTEDRIRQMRRTALVGRREL